MNARELAAAIRKGATMVTETTKNHCGCAIGTIFLAVTGKNLVHDYMKVGAPLGGDCYIDAVAHVCNASRKLIREIEMKHIHGTPRLAIADWLDTLEPAQEQPAHPFIAQMKDFATLVSVELDKEVS